MLYRNVEQGLRCQTLNKSLKEAETDVRNWEEHLVVLKDNIRTENWLLDSLRNQAERTGDHEGFAYEIRQKEDKIGNLERQVREAEENVRKWRQRVSTLENEMNQLGCHGFA